MSAKLVIEAAKRNKGPILEVLQKVLPEKFGDKAINALEIGSGSGQHVVQFAKELNNVTWQPSDVADKYLTSINAYIEESGLASIKKPISYDISKSVADVEELDKQYDLMISINLVHISPWKCSEGLFKAAGKLLTPKGILVTYGPYAIHGEILPESNVKFNEGLKAQNPEWGLRDIDDLEKEAKKNGLTFDAMFDMPANNKTLIWLKQ